MKKFFMLWVLAAFPLFLLAQSPYFCGTDEANRKMYDQYPELQKLRKEMDSLSLVYQAIHLDQVKAGGKRANEPYIIPIVFHIIHDYGTENITDDQIYDQVEILNEDFRKRNPDTSAIRPPFKSIAADAEIEFRLATKDPKGNCTSGIDRVRSVLTYRGSDDAKLNPWPRHVYLNVWVIRTMLSAGTAGYAYYPTALTGERSAADGIILLHDYNGSIGTGNPNRSRALTHEIGHFLNLPHCWGEGELGAACGDDGILDTPVTKGWDFCKSAPTDVCTDDVEENVQNYMEYSYCSLMFTEGQKAAMHLALNSPAGQRNQLWSNYAFTRSGADVSNNTNTCPPIADFNTKKRTTCVGANVTFTDFSYQGPITGRSWTFSNATPPTSTDQNPTVVFNQAGWQKVSLTVTNANGQDTREEETYIYVNDGTADEFVESFDDHQLIEKGWLVDNSDNNRSQWEITNGGAFAGGGSLRLETYGVGRYDRDAIYSPEYSVFGYTEMSFKLASASKSTVATGMINEFEVSYSIDCGTTWAPFHTLSGAAAVTAGYVGEYYKPTSEDDWRTITVPLPTAVVNNGKAMFRFELTYDENSNNLYIDELNLNRVYSGIREIAAEGLGLFPNPNVGSFMLQLGSETAGNALVQVFDVTGRNVFTQDHTLKAGQNQLAVSTGLPEGMYFVKVRNGEQSWNRSFVVSR